jgi:hypothetical protein
MSFVFWDKVLLFTYFIFWKQPTFLKVVEFLSGLASSKLNILVWCALVIIVGWFLLSKCMFVYLQHSLCKSKKIILLEYMFGIDSEFGWITADHRVFLQKLVSYILEFQKITVLSWFHQTRCQCPWCTLLFVFFTVMHSKSLNLTQLLV